MRFYRLLLRLYPASFRAEYGDEMCAVFAARRREVNPLALWGEAISDVIANAVRVHVNLLRDDLRWATRVLWKSPAFTLTAVLVASLGMGATTAAFTLVDHVLLRPLPFPRPEQLVALNEIERDGSFEPATPPGFDDWRAMNTSFSAMGAYIGASLPMNLSGGGEPLRGRVARGLHPRGRVAGIAVLPDLPGAVGERRDVERGGIRRQLRRVGRRAGAQPPRRRSPPR